jgi:flavin-dependent dehydrogenase
MNKSKPTSASNQYDVVVIGGGPGGATLAALLAQRGRRCLVLEQSQFPRYHIGESLVPHTHGIFERLGFLDKLKQSAFPEKHSVRFVPVAGGDATSFFFSWTIPGDGARTWQVERSQFDRMMLDHARELGVEVREGVTVEKVVFAGNRATGVVASNGTGKHTIEAKVVVDASGRRTLIGQQLGLKGDVPGLKKASLWGYYSGGKRWPGLSAGETTMFLIPEGGWFWYIPLPDDIVSVGIVADPDYLFGAGGTPEAIFEREVTRCATLTERLTTTRRVGPVRGLRELAYVNRQTCGDGWVMIGDARAFLDPIYSSGLFLALASAELAASCIESALAANDVSAARLGAFEPALWDGIDSVRRLIYAFYDPNFSFREFLDRHPEHRRSLIDCLVGDVVKDMSSFKQALAGMTPPPPPLSDSTPLTKSVWSAEEEL